LLVSGVDVGGIGGFELIGSELFEHAPEVGQRDDGWERISIADLSSERGDADGVGDRCERDVLGEEVGGDGPVGPSGGRGCRGPGGRGG
jgi:hypothetical protein